MRSVTEIQRADRDADLRAFEAKLRRPAPVTAEEVAEIERDLALINDPGHYPPDKAFSLSFNYAVKLLRGYKALLAERGEG